MTVVLFWDIDGTLLTTARAGILAWEDAVAEVLGTLLSLERMHTAGLTDVEIAKEILHLYAVEPRTVLVQALVRRYEERLPARLPLRPGRVLPGVQEILGDLKDRPEAHSLLLTGNTAAGARAKLTHYGLWPYFSGGAFADDGDDRVGIARHALAIAQKRFGPLALDDAYVIGDTPHDIACGHAIGVRTIAVATGPHSVADLAVHRPWWVMERLPDPETFVRTVTQKPSPDWGGTGASRAGRGRQARARRKPS